MKKKQSIIGTFYLNITIVIFSSLVIMIALAGYHLLSSTDNEQNFSYFLQNMKSTELSLVFLFAILTTLIVSKFISNDLRAHFKLFNIYFHDASKNLKKIDTEKLEYCEFEELATSVNELVENMQASHKEVLFHRSYLQAVLESQKNIILVIADETMISVNKAFLDFFQVSSIQAFYNKEEKLCAMFLEEEGYIGCEVDGMMWKDYIAANPTQLHKVKLSYAEKEHIFSIEAAKIEDSEQLVVSLSNITELENERKLFEKVASTDALTGIANRLKFNSILEQQIALAKRYKTPFSVILFDVDDFKRVNDTYGHKVGDEVLISLSKEVSKNIRESDTFARWGGEEFVLVLPQTSEKEAYILAEKIRKKIALLTFSLSFKITCSFGVGEYTGQEDSDVFMQEVDWLLYKAKHSGKDRVCMA
jgi:diguanylate cyclase (GGDEF)-like protein